MTFNDWLLTFLFLVSAYSVVVTAVLVAQRRQHNDKQAQNNTNIQRVHIEALDEKEKRFQATADEALRLSQTFQKFVPKQFVDHIAKKGSDTLELGHADEDEVAILFCDIRGFTGLSEKMRPQELMNFLNSYFLRMNDPIHQNQGFIDKFIGDAIMALFDHPGGSAKEKAVDALNAALDLRKALGIYNKHRGNSGYDPINVGVGIHFGPVILGTVGSDDRMDTTVIGDSVNIAFRLESLTTKYNADIIVSAQVLQTIGADFPIKTRLLDWVRVKGREAPIEIYEILSHLPKEEQDIRYSVQTKIAAGLACRINKQWDEAIAHFNAALTINPNDLLVKHHLAVCKMHRNMELPDDWDGALNIQ